MRDGKMPIVIVVNETVVTSESVSKTKKPLDQFVWIRTAIYLSLLFMGSSSGVMYVKHMVVLE
jgi:hypothetical protein